MAQALKREIGIVGAVAMGLGSIIGTGVFVSIGIGAGVAGASVLLAIMVAALVATMNGLSSAQLAANHPVSGGTYEYGYRYLSPLWGFTAGWLFLLAKSASAATAALGASGYLLGLMDGDRGFIVPLAISFVLVLMAIVLLGIRRSNQVNLMITAFTVGVLLLFVMAGLGTWDAGAFEHWQTIDNQTDGTPLSLELFLQATALMFVAYTGYGRIATLGEEVHQPRRTIPIAVVVALLVTMVLYGLVGLVAIGNGGAMALGSAVAQGTAPLERIAQNFHLDWVVVLVAVGAITAMLSVLLNLILGLSRVLLAMGRRGDMPAMMGRLNEAGTTPTMAVIGVTVVIGILVLLGDVRTTWTFSAFNVLIYYAITNLSAMRLQPHERLFPKWVAMLGLASCVFLAFWVDTDVWLFGLVLIGIGWAWFWGVRHLASLRV